MATDNVNPTKLQPDTAGYALVGLPSWEEVEDDLAPSTLSVGDDPKPTPKSMGDDDVESIIYINLEKKIPDELQARLKQLESMIKISNQWLSVKAGILAEKKIINKELPSGGGIDDQLKRAAYRAKVVDIYMSQRMSWMSPYATDIRKYAISVKKSELHLKILKVVIEGITVPTKIHEKLESIFKSISEGIQTASKNKTQKQLYWILLTVYKYDERLGEVVPTLRTIYFTISEDIQEYTSNKTKYEQANFIFGFSQRDFHFAEGIWKGVENETAKYLTELGIEIVRDTPDVPVDDD